MDWIKTSDRLPVCNEEDCSDEVIIFANGKVITGMRYWKCDNMFMDEMDTVFPLNDVSHWMPLPKAPHD